MSRRRMAGGSRRALAPWWVAAALALAGCGPPLLVDPVVDHGPAPRATRLVRLTGAGPVPARVELRAGDTLVVLAERPDGPLAVVVDGHPADPASAAREGFAADDATTFTPVPLAAGASAALRCDAPGTYLARVHAPDGSASDLLLVVAADQ